MVRIPSLPRFRTRYVISRPTLSERPYSRIVEGGVGPRQLQQQRPEQQGRQQEEQRRRRGPDNGVGTVTRGRHAT